MNALTDGGGVRPVVEERQGFNWRGFLALGLIVALVGALGSWGWDQFGPESQAPLVRADAVANGTVRYYSERGFYLVREETGSLLALDHRDTAPAYRGRDCAVAWRPDRASDGRPGVFSGRCSGSVWAIDGTPIEGSSGRSLDRYAVRQNEKGEVFVDKGVRAP